MSRELDRVSAAAGVAVTLMGVLLLLDQEDVVELSLGLVGALIAAVLGADPDRQRTRRGRPVER